MNKSLFSLKAGSVVIRVQMCQRDREMLPSMQPSSGNASSPWEQLTGVLLCCSPSAEGRSGLTALLKVVFLKRLIFKHHISTITSSLKPVFLLEHPVKLKRGAEESCSLHRTCAWLVCPGTCSPSMPWLKPVLHGEPGWAVSVTQGSVPAPQGRAGDRELALHTAPGSRAQGARGQVPREPAHLLGSMYLANVPSSLPFLRGLFLTLLSIPL